MSERVESNILERIAELSSEIKELRAIRREIALTGTASASISAGGGSKSYTRQSLPELTKLISDNERELRALRARLTGSSPIRRIMTIRGY